MEDVIKVMPYAPYLMFMIERFIGWKTVNPIKRLESMQGGHLFLQYSHHQGLTPSLASLTQIQRLMRRRRSRSS